MCLQMFFDFQKYTFSSVWQNFFSVLRFFINFAINKAVAHTAD